MSSITSVEPQKKNSRRFNVYLDGEFAFGADEDLVVNYRLLPGKEISRQDLEKLLYEAEVGKLMEKIYRLFSIRQRSEQEVRNYLRQLSFKKKLQDDEEISELTVDRLIERLKKKGLINDLEFSREWADSKRRSKSLGPKALKVELIKKGIAREIIDQVLADQPVDNEQLAKEALEKRVSRWKNLSRLEFKKKATDYLLRKGFEWETVKGVVEKMF